MMAVVNSDDRESEPLSALPFVTLMTKNDHATPSNASKHLRLVAAGDKVTCVTSRRWICRGGGGIIQIGLTVGFLHTVRATLWTFPPRERGRLRIKRRMTKRNTVLDADGDDRMIRGPEAWEKGPKVR